MKQIRWITHNDQHVDEETLINGVWAVTRCDVKLETKGITMTTYDLDYAARRLQDAIDFSQAEGDFSQARIWSMNLIATAKELQQSVKDLEDGMSLMLNVHPVEQAQAIEKLIDAQLDPRTDAERGYDEDSADLQATQRDAQ
jgi:hypothetical protein